MTQQTFNTLMHYTEKLTRDPDDRKELVLLAWKESLRLKERANIPLMINHMKLRAREMNKRSALGNKISGKSQRDVWNHSRISISTPIENKTGFTLQETLTSYSNPLSECIVNDFMDSMSGLEKEVANKIMAGYKEKEITSSLGITSTEYYRIRNAVREKASEYL